MPKSSSSSASASASVMKSSKARNAGKVKHRVKVEPAPRDGQRNPLLAAREKYIMSLKPVKKTLAADDESVTTAQDPAGRDEKAPGGHYKLPTGVNMVCIDDQYFAFSCGHSAPQSGSANDGLATGRVVVDHTGTIQVSSTPCPHHDDVVPEAGMSFTKHSPIMELPNESSPTLETNEVATAESAVAKDIHEDVHDESLWSGSDHDRHTSESEDDSGGSPDSEALPEPLVDEMDSAQPLETGTDDPTPPAVAFDNEFQPPTVATFLPMLPKMADYPPSTNSLGHIPEVCDKWVMPLPVATAKAPEAEAEFGKDVEDIVEELTELHQNEVEDVSSEENIDGEDHAVANAAGTILSLPDGAVLSFPDGSTLAVPNGSTLVIPNGSDTPQPMPAPEAEAALASTAHEVPLNFKEHDAEDIENEADGVEVAETLESQEIKDDEVLEPTQDVEVSVEATSVLPSILQDDLEHDPQHESEHEGEEVSPNSTELEAESTPEETGHIEVVETRKSVKTTISKLRQQPNVVDLASEGIVVRDFAYSPYTIVLSQSSFNGNETSAEGESHSGRQLTPTNRTSPSPPADNNRKANRHSRDRYELYHTFIGTASFASFIQELELLDDNVDKANICSALIDLTAKESEIMKANGSSTGYMIPMSKEAAEDFESFVQKQVKLGNISLHQFLQQIPFKEGNKTGILDIVQVFKNLALIDSDASTNPAPKRSICRRVVNHSRRAPTVEAAN